MKRITLLFLFLSICSFAQFTTNDVKFYVGEGDQTAYFIADFKDGTDDRSYAWGIRFNQDEPINGTEMLQLISEYEPNFSYEQSGGFLDQIAFNHHDSYEQEYDYWSLWTSRNGQDWIMEGWMTSDLIDGKWYAATYGFGMNVPGPDAPVTPIPAYSSLWLQQNQVTTWIGTGSNSSLVIIDFGTDTNNVADSFVVGINYNGNLTVEQALQIVQENNANFTFSITNDQISALQLGNYAQTNTPRLFKGTDLSNWITQENATSFTLANNQWLGISFGTRRPYIPQEMEVENLGTMNWSTSSLQVYPNPTTDYIIVNSKNTIKEINIYNTVGSLVKTAKTAKIQLEQLPAGIYFIEVNTNQSKEIKKIIKK